MPKKTEDNNSKKTKKTLNNVVKKNTKDTKSTVKKTDLKNSKKVTSKTKTSTLKKSTTKTKTSTSKKSNSKSKVTTLNTKSKNKTAITFSPEYYDLPFKYEQTMVKILAQTPKTLFIYWEISDNDRENLKSKYGKYLFEITKPVLIIYNETMNYSFEVDINDFANSWYLHVNDSNCEYKIELGRRPIPINYSYISDYNVEKNGPISPINTQYIYISSSNELKSPNDKILFNKIRKIYFRNVKTNELIEKDISDFPNIYMDGKFINIYKLYQELYKKEIKNDSFNLYNPSSGNIGSGSFSSRFY